MSPRIIAGSARGYRIAAPKGKEVRPTSDRVREALFSVLAPRLPDCRFLDLYAGTGVNGLEALSRGAAQATFVDSQQRVLDRIREDASAIGLLSRARFQRLTLPHGLSRLEGAEEGFDIIFADPPYAAGHYESLLAGLAALVPLKPGGIIVIEHSVRTEIPETAGPYSRSRVNKYGETALSFFT